MRQPLVAILLTFLGLAGCGAGEPDREPPSCGGVGLREWAIRLGAGRGDEPRDRRAVAEAQDRLAKHGADAIPLLEALLDSDAIPERLAALRVAVRMRGEAAPLVDRLIRIMREHPGAQDLTARQALVAIGPAAAPRLRAAIRDAEGRRGLTFVTVLLRLGPGLGEEALPRIRAALRSTDRAERSTAMFGIQRAGEVARPAAPELVLQLRERDTDHVKAALSALTACGAGEEIVPAILALCESSVPHERRHAIIALKTLGPSATAALPRLLTLSRDDSVLEAWMDDTILAMGAAGVPGLIQELRTAAWGRRYRVARYLGGLGETALPAVPELLRCWATCEPKNRKIIRRVLERIGPATRTAIEELGEASDGPLREAARKYLQ